MPVRADEIAMDGLNEWGPTIVGAGLLAYVWYTYFCIKRGAGPGGRRGGGVILRLAGPGRRDKQVELSAPKNAYCPHFLGGTDRSVACSQNWIWSQFPPDSYKRWSMETFNRFLLETKRLQSMAAVTQFSYSFVRDEVTRQKRLGQLKAGDQVELSNAGGVLISTNYYSLINALNSRYPRYARETVLVRLISTFEVFLVDVVRDLFMHRPDLFHDQKKRVEITYGELFSAENITAIRSKAIYKELRQLHSGGLREIAKYYRSKIGIDFDSLGLNMKHIWEAVDRRHLLVHALGRADAAYRKTYGYSKKLPLSVSADYLFSTINSIQQVAENLKPKVASLLDQATVQESKSEKGTYAKLIMSDLPQDVLKLLRPEFAFVHNDSISGERIVHLSDILLEKTDTDGTIELRLQGEANVVTSYLKLLKKQRNKLGVKMKSMEMRRERGIERSRTVDKNIVDQVRMRLPAKPWPQGIHKIIASDLGISNSLCSKAIAVVLSDGTVDSIPES